MVSQELVKVNGLDAELVHRYRVAGRYLSAIDVSAFTPANGVDITVSVPNLVEGQREEGIERPVDYMTDNSFVGMQYEADLKKHRGSITLGIGDENFSNPDIRQQMNEAIWSGTLALNGILQNSPKYKSLISKTEKAFVASTCLSGLGIIGTIVASAKIPGFADNASPDWLSLPMFTSMASPLIPATSKFYLERQKDRLSYRTKQQIGRKSASLALKYPIFETI